MSWRKKKKKEVENLCHPPNLLLVHSLRVLAENSSQCRQSSKNMTPQLHFGGVRNKAKVELTTWQSVFSSSLLHLSRLCMSFGGLRQGGAQIKLAKKWYIQIHANEKERASGFAYHCTVDCVLDFCFRSKKTFRVKMNCLKTDIFRKTIDIFTSKLIY